MDDSEAWAAVARQAARPDAAAIRARFAADPDRPARYTFRAAGLVLDLSRSSLDGGSCPPCSPWRGRGMWQGGAPPWRVARR